MTKQDVIDQVCTNPKDNQTWGEWKNDFKFGGLKVVNDDGSGFMDTKVLFAAEAAKAVMLCECELLPQEEEDPVMGATFVQGIPEQEQLRVTRPPEVTVLVPERQLGVIPKPADKSKSVETSTVQLVKAGSTHTLTVPEWRKQYDFVSNHPPIDDFVQAEEGQIRLEIELHAGKPPFIFTRLYIRNIVGVQPAWYAQGEKHTNSFGWKVVLLPKARDDVVKRLGVLKNVVYVKMLRIIKMSETKRSLLAEVVQW